MPIREIVTPPAPVLRQKARKVTQFTPELHALIDDMVETMRAAPGVGLAAPQVNIPLRVIVVEYTEDEEGEKPPRTYAVVNPEVARMTPETEIGAEGCLSIPGYLGEVERATGVTVKGFDRHGKPIKIKASGWMARIFQHEIDHLDGILFPDRAERVWKMEDEPSETVSAD
jgi:peptide deformylase